MSRTWLLHSAFTQPQTYKLLMRMSFRGFTCNFNLLHTCYCYSNPLLTYFLFHLVTPMLSWILCVVEGGDTPQDEISLTHETESQSTLVNMRKCIQSLRPVNTDVLDLQTKKE